MPTRGGTDGTSPAGSFSKNGNVRNPVSRRRDFLPHLDHDENPGSLLQCLKQRAKPKLNLRVPLIAHVPFHNLAVEIFAVGAVERCVEIFVHAHERLRAHMKSLPAFPRLWVSFIVNRHQVRERHLRVFLCRRQARMA